MEIGNLAPAAPEQKQIKPAGGAADKERAAVKKVAQEFEALFVTMMLKSMRSTVGQDQLTGGGRGEETFRSLLDQEYANAAVRGGGIGLAPVLERELMRQRTTVKGDSNAD
ncbi:rod binding protein [Geoanaerobacter pelophilus]|uniref:Rod binding protein n=1 Tax=Geoanaerobacter pelophilus TaxID=60036 RepID=A0ABQ0MNI6_9BACT|nr:rod-binding protein [Geoanaerobacter pelophilus]GAW68620.1 rod binding protein [Geoanaerobacter pelophilus]